MSGRRDFLRGLAAMPLATLPAATPNDAELLRLGTAFELAWDRQAACERNCPPLNSSDDACDASYEAFEKAYEATDAIVDKIEGVRATTLGGILVKLRACSWCHGGAPFDGSFLWENSHGTPAMDLRLAEAILRDLLAIDGRPVPYVELDGASS